MWKHHDGSEVITLDHGTWHHELDFETMTQTNLDTSTARRIRRVLVESD